MHKKICKALLAVGLGAVLCLNGCSDSKSKGAQSQTQAQQVTRISGKTMGTVYGVIVPGGYSKGEAELRKLSEDTFQKICDSISTFDPKAELALFNEHKSTSPFPISEYLARVIQECNHISRRIDGAMDISVGPLVNLWGFGKDKATHQSPSAEQIAEAQKLVGLDVYQVRNTPNGSLLIKKDPNVRLDLSTVGEGLGADAVASILIKEGVKDFFVNVAGANRSRGFNPKGELWRVGIEDPTNPDHNVFAVVCPRNQAMSTAGSYRNFFKDEKNGTFYSHIIDPSTGRPVDHSTVSVTVIGHSALTTDALDTGLLVLGADKALDWANKYQVPIYTIEYKDGKAVGRYSQAFEQYLKCDLKRQSLR